MLLIDSILQLYSRGIDLWDAGIENAVAAAKDQRMLLTQRIGKAGARRDVICVEGDSSRIRPQRI